MTTPENIEDRKTDSAVMAWLSRALNPERTWFERREACRKVERLIVDFTEWAEGELAAAFLKIGECPCCPHPRPMENGACALEYFRQEWWTRGGPGQDLALPIAERVEKYVAHLPVDAAVRFKDALMGYGRITVEDYVHVMKTVQEVMEKGWERLRMPGAYEEVEVDWP